jgi:hypothetical protein
VVVTHSFTMKGAKTTKFMIKDVRILRDLRALRGYLLARSKQ